MRINNLEVVFWARFCVFYRGDVSRRLSHSVPRGAVLFCRDDAVLWVFGLHKLLSTCDHECCGLRRGRGEQEIVASRGEKPRRSYKNVRCPCAEESGSGQLSCSGRRTPHLTRGHGRGGPGGRVQAEDARFQKRYHVSHT